MDFWNDFPLYRNRDRFTHLIHSYPAKLLASIPAFFVSIFCERGSRILDPFCGSGTVLLEGSLQGCESYGVEVNPVARLISQVKITPIDPIALQERLEELLTSIGQTKDTLTIAPSQLDFWFAPEVKTQLLILKDVLKSFTPSEDPDEIYLRNFFWMCFSSMIRRKSLADPRISPPVRLKPEKFIEDPVRHQKSINMLEQKKKSDVFDVFAAISKENIERTRQLYNHFRNEEMTPCGRVVWDDARVIGKGSLGERGVIHNTTTKRFPSSSIDLILTSPPYIDAQKYTRSLSLEMYWLEHWKGPEDRAMYDHRVLGNERVKATEVFLNGDTPPILRKELLRIADIDRKRAAVVEAFFQGMVAVLKECYRVLKKGGHMVLIIGNNKIFGKEIPTHRILTKVISKIGFITELVLYDDIKTWGLMRERNSTADIITREWILVFQKE